jgi:hypothetical protein
MVKLNLFLLKSGRKKKHHHLAKADALKRKPTVNLAGNFNLKGLKVKTQRTKAFTVDGSHSMWPFTKTLADFAVKILCSYSSKTVKSTVQTENILLRLP